MLLPRLRDLREDRDWKQEEVARRIGVKQTTYSKYELGKINVPLGILIQLAEIYQVSLDYLTGLSDDPRRR